MDYQYNNAFQPYTINGLSFDSTVNVIQDNDSNLVYVINESEMYAKNVGMIYKRFRSVGKFPSISYPDSVIGGVDYTYKIISYGN